MKPRKNPRVDGKRVLDLTLSGLLLAVTSPLLAASAMAIKLDSTGPVLFRQERVGLGGLTFRIHKFRSMSVQHDGRLVSSTGDTRVTRVGRLLRRTKLDELPQLIDVLQGHMSLVGPRPEVPTYVHQWSAERREVILSVRPGITDPASVELRHEADELAGVSDPEAYYVEVLLPRKTAVYVDYVMNRSLLGDVAILLRTVRALATR
ncbi:MAG: sugar transferase [Pseudolysinimonas sp.]